MEDEDVALLDSLPLNYDETTIRTMEQIDVLWLRGRAIQRAFEVEHTTSTTREAAGAPVGQRAGGGGGGGGVGGQVRLAHLDYGFEPGRFGG
jgi:hypothetical protein